MEKNFDAQDSLNVINGMIAQTRNNIRIGSANSMIFCGYFVMIVAALNIMLLHVLDKPYYSFWVWALTIPMTVISNIISSRRDKHAIVRTHNDRIVSKVWVGFSCSVFILLASIFAAVFVFDLWSFTVLIMPTMLVMTGLAQFIVASATNFKPFLWAAYMFWLGALLSVLAFLFIKLIDIQFVILALCMLFGFVAPGHILNRKAKEHV